MIHFNFSQVEDPNFDNFLEKHAPNGLGLTVEFNLGVENSGKSQGI